MIQENEVITLILGVGALIFVAFNHRALRGVRHSKILISALIVTFWAWALTNLEALIWYDFINCLEHVCYGVSSVLLAVWCIISISSKGEAR